MAEMSQFEPSEDGLTHINIYSKGKTALGRFMSHFAKELITTPEGQFMSVEGYWYWLGSKHPEKDRLRSLWGFDAKRVGKELRPNKEPLTQAFKDKICEANRQKMLKSPFLAEFKSLTLPFTHYYVFKNGFAQDASDSEWLLEFWTSLRTELQNEVTNTQ